MSAVRSVLVLLTTLGVYYTRKQGWNTYNELASGSCTNVCFGPPPSLAPCVCEMISSPTPLLLFLLVRLSAVPLDFSLICVDNLLSGCF